MSVDWLAGAALPYCHLVPFGLLDGGEQGGPLLAQRTVAFWATVTAQMAVGQVRLTLAFLLDCGPPVKIACLPAVIPRSALV